MPIYFKRLAEYVSQLPGIYQLPLMSNWLLDSYVKLFFYMMSKTPCF